MDSRDKKIAACILEVQQGAEYHSRFNNDYSLRDSFDDWIMEGSTEAWLIEAIESALFTTPLYYNHHTRL